MAASEVDGKARRRIFRKWIALFIPFILIGIFELVIRILEQNGVPSFFYNQDRRPDNFPNTTGEKFKSQVVYFRSDSDLFWRFEPKLDDRRFFRGVGEEIRTTTNERGERGRLWGWEKPAGCIRIVILGDSSSAGYGLNDDEIYAEQLQRKLDSVKPEHYQVINLACFGYTSLQNRRMLDLDGRRYHPDFVVLSCGFNDRSAERVKPDSAYEYPRGIIGGIFFFLHESRFVRFLRWVIYGIRDWITGNKITEEDYVPRVSMAEFKVNLEKSVELARGMGAQIVFLPISLADDYLVILEEVAREKQVPIINFEQRVAQLYPQLDAMPVPSYGGSKPKIVYELLDISNAQAIMAPWRVEIRRKSYFFFDFCHPNNVGDVLIADLLCDFITFQR